MTKKIEASQSNRVDISLSEESSPPSGIQKKEEWDDSSKQGSSSDPPSRDEEAEGTDAQRVSQPTVVDVCF